tara:strand:- start:212 stop:448 length:237 start_codon:yes stop_codon:yes gene_type:complete
MKKYWLNKTKYLIEFLEKQKKEGFGHNYMIINKNNAPFLNLGETEYVEIDLIHDDKLFWLGAGYQKFLTTKKQKTNDK